MGVFCVYMSVYVWYFGIYGIVSIVWICSGVFWVIGGDVIVVWML